MSRRGISTGIGTGWVPFIVLFPVLPPGPSTCGSSSEALKGLGILLLPTQRCSGVFILKVQGRGKSTYCKGAGPSEQGQWRVRKRDSKKTAWSIWKINHRVLFGECPSNQTYYYYFFFMRLKNLLTTRGNISIQLDI